MEKLSLQTLIEKYNINKSITPSIIFKDYFAIDVNSDNIATPIWGMVTNEYIHCDEHLFDLMEFKGTFNTKLSQFKKLCEKHNISYKNSSINTLDLIFLIINRKACSNLYQLYLIFNQVYKIYLLYMNYVKDVELALTLDYISKMKEIITSETRNE